MVRVHHILFFKKSNFIFLKISKRERCALFSCLQGTRRSLNEQRARRCFLERCYHQQQLQQSQQQQQQP
jgi:transcription initiation factor TFIID subunit TAF12